MRSIFDEVERIGSPALVDHINVGIIEEICHGFVSNFICWITVAGVFDTTIVIWTFLTCPYIDLTKEHRV